MNKSISRLLVCAMCLLACLGQSVANAAWGCKFEVWNGAAWVSSVNVAPGATVKFRFGTYFDAGTQVTTPDGTGNALALNRFTGSNQFTNFAAGDAFQALTRTASSGNVALLTTSGGTIGGTGITSFGGQLLLSLPSAPETYFQIYTGEIRLSASNLSARTLVFQNKTFGSGATKGVTFYHDASANNKQSNQPETGRADITASINVGCAAPSISGPSPSTVCVGESAAFSVSVTGVPVTYQWRKNTQPLAGQNGPTLTLNLVSPSEQGQYDCLIATDCQTYTSQAATLTVLQPPSIFSQPRSVVARPGTNATLSVIATGDHALTYAWFKGVTQLVDGGRISGASTAVLSISSVLPGDSGTYFCVVTDPQAVNCGTAQSTVATLSVGDCTVEWKQVSTTGPGPRRNPGLAYDAKRERLVLFGGSNDSGPLGDTWEWDGSVWTQRSSGGPVPRFGHAMAFDAARDRVILFGGYAAGNIAQGDTWSWDGTSWTRVATTGPSARFYPTMTFDAARGEVILFGGVQQDFGLPTQTWAWNGSLWMQVANSGPAGRYASSIAYDAARQRVVLFGGFNLASVNFDDTWEWDGDQWTQKASGTPTARTGAMLAFDPGRGRIIMFGGRLLVEDEISWSSRTWEWDGATWVSTLTGVPSARWIGAMTLDTTKGRIVLFGGESSTGTLLGDTWELASRIPITSQPTSVARNFGETANFSVAAVGLNLAYQWRRNGVPVVNSVRITGATSASLAIAQVGLQDEGSYDVVITSPCGTETSQLASLSVATCPSSWQNLGAVGPSPRWNGAVASDLARNQIVLFGGRSTTGLTFLGETWIWAGSNWSQRVVSGPSPRSDATMASLASGVILFGGRDTSGNTYLNDTWIWNGTAWVLQNPVTKPPARLGCTMVYDAARNRVVMFGGVLSGDVFAGDTWEWDGVNWTQVAASGPAARFGHHMSYDAQRQRTVMFGGALFFGTVFFDTWEWDGVSWEKRAEGGPPSQIYGAMAYDPGRQRSVYVTGYTFNRVFSSETWEWNGISWSKSLNTAPPPRQNTYMAYDYQRSRMVLFGGYNPAGTLLNDTWGLVLGPSVISQPVSQSIRATQTAIFSVTGSSFGLQYRWLRNGIAMNDGGNVSGSATSVLTISGVTAADASSYRVRVTDACGSQVISNPATLTVTCVADLNGDGYVDDPDFTLFIRAYDTLLCPVLPTPCPADFNLDGFVDDQDFQVFVVQYDELICP